MRPLSAPVYWLRLMSRLPKFGEFRIDKNILLRALDVQLPGAATMPSAVNSSISTVWPSVQRRDGSGKQRPAVAVDHGGISATEDVICSGHRPADDVRESMEVRRTALAGGTDFAGSSGT